MTSAPFTLLIQSNSPGELSHWVTPMVEAFVKAVPDIDIWIFLTPCQYASGQERNIAEALPKVSRVFSPRESIRHIFRPPYFSRPFKKGAVLYLGGDPMYSQLLGLKYGLPVYGYSHRNTSLGPLFKRIFSLEADGDLMGSRIATLKFNVEEIKNKYNIYDERNVLFFPGSRPNHFFYIMDWIGPAIVDLARVDETFRPLVMVSPFVSDALLEEVSSDARFKTLRFIRGDSLEMMAVSEALITIAGTNNVEAMYMGIPMMVMIPLHRIKELIFDGVLGLLAKMPVLGAIVRYALVAVLTRRKMPFTLVNQWLGNGTVQEIVGKYSREEWQAHIAAFWQDKLAQQAQRERFVAVQEDNRNNRVAEGICNRILKDT